VDFLTERVREYLGNAYLLDPYMGKKLPAKMKKKKVWDERLMLKDLKDVI